MKKVSEEIRICKALECENSFTCLPSSKKKYCCVKCAAITNSSAGHSEEWRKKVSESNTGKKHSDETKKKIAKSMTGRTHTQETKDKCSLKNRGYHIPREVRTCLNPSCGNTFVCSVNQEKKYCSLSCSSSCGGNKKYFTMESRECASPQCSNIFECREDSSQKYCNRKCVGIGRKLSLEHREKISLGNVRRQLEGWTFKSKYKIGYFVSQRFDKTFYFRSSYELAALKLFENDSIIRNVKTEPFAISYTVEGCFHHYIPDYLVTLENDKHFIIEVKPEVFILDEINSSKFIAAENFASIHDMNFLILSENDLFCKNSVTTTMLVEKLNQRFHLERSRWTRQPSFIVKDDDIVWPMQKCVEDGRNDHLAYERSEE